MKKSLKKLLCLMLVILLLLPFINKTHIKAATTSDNNVGLYDVTSNVRTDRFSSNTNHITDLGNTSKSGSSPLLQQVNVFTQTQTANSKVVTWAVGDEDGFTRKNIIAIARDYERTHPDWIVLGGTNADQYYQYAGALGHTNGSDYFYPQPYYPMICDGESWFSISCTPYGAQNVVGIINDGSTTDSLVSGKATWGSGDFKLAGFFLSIIDESGKVLQKFKIDKYNEAPNANETTLYTSYWQYINNDYVFPSMDISGDSLYVVSKAERAYPTNSITYTYKSNTKNAQNAFFGKGEISSIVTSVSISSGQFAISSNNSEVKNALAVGKRILVQYEYEGILGSVESAIGYHTVQRLDNKDVDTNATNSYNSQQYARSIIGRKQNGQIVLLTIDKASSYKGTSHYETNAIIKHYGMVEAYQMDGGGSVSAMVREGDEFKCTNVPADGGLRSVLSALLVVERRDPVVTCTVKEATATTLTFDVNIKELYGREVSKVYVRLGRNDYEVSNGSVTITDLRKGREYDYSVYFEDSNGILTKVTDINQVSTTKQNPALLSCVYDDSIKSYKVVFDDPDTTLTDVCIKYNDKTYNLVNNIIAVPLENNGVPVLEYTYDTGNGKIIIRVEYPSYGAYHIVEYINKEKNKILDEMFK